MNYQTPIRIVTSGDFSPELQPVIKPVTSSRQLFEVYRMNFECYASQTLGMPRGDGVWISHPELDHTPDTTILVAEMAEEIIATVSITLDGKQGLPIDRSLLNTSMLIRSQGRRLAQVWRLLLKKGCPSPENVITSLLVEADRLLVSANVQTILYFIEEEHAPFCRELTGAVTLMRAKSTRELPHVTGLLMLSKNPT